VIKKFLRFGLLSGCGWLLDCTVLLLLTTVAAMPIFAANFLSSSLAALSVFLYSRRFVFEGSNAPIAGKLLTYAAYTALVIILASVCIGPVRALVTHLAAEIHFVLSDRETAFFSKVLITPPQLLANFLMSRLLIEEKYKNDKR
jgi:putative flippase GtrA